MPDQKFEATIRIVRRNGLPFCRDWPRGQCEIQVRGEFEMMKFVAVGLTSGVLSLIAASSAHACGGSGGSCSMGAAPATAASAKATRSYSYAPSASNYRPQMMMRGGMMGGGMSNAVPHAAGAKVSGN
jgi:hypothetical protein